MSEQASAAAKPATLKSMTGYAQARAEEAGWSLRVSVRSVNHRFLDLHVRLPEGFEQLEPAFRRLIRERVRRGHVDVTLRVEPSSQAAVQVNKELAGAYGRAAQDIARQFNANALPDFIAVLRLPGVIAGAGAPPEGEQEKVGKRTLACLEEALGKLDEMRGAEGQALAEEMRGRVRVLGDHTATLEAMADRLRPAYAKRLETRLKDLLGGASLEPARLAQEAALLAERADITEEVSRLRSHLHQLDQLLGAGAESGKKLDFLLQEMQREASTMLAKAPGVEAEGLAITNLGLEVKAELERLREQIQNVE